MASDKDKETELLLKAKDLTGEAFALVSKRLKELKDETKDTTEKGGAAWGKLFGTISGGVAVGNLISSAFQTAAGVLASVPGQLMDLAKRGSDVSDVRDSFTKLNAAIGQTGNEVLPELSAAFGHTVTDYNLMRDANEALSKGAKLSAADMATMAKASRVMSDQVGGDSREKWNAMMGAIANGQEKQLRTLPLDYARIEKAVDAHATKLGVEASALSVSQRQTALRNAVLQESTRILKENGEVQNDMGDNLAAVATSWENIKDRVGEAIAQSPSLNTALGMMSSALTEAFGPDRDAQIKTITTLIAQVAQAAIVAADFIAGVAQKVQSGFSKAGIAVQQTVSSFYASSIKEQEEFVRIQAGIAEKGDAGELARLRQMQTRLAEMKGFNAKLIDEINGGLTANDQRNAALDSLRKKLADLGIAMEKAEAGANKAGAATGGLVKTHQALGDIIEPNAKMLETFTKKVEAMRKEAALAETNGSLETWAKRNASALLDTLQKATEFKQKFPAELREAFQLAAKLQLDAEAGKRTPEIMAADLEAVKKGLEERGKLWMAATEKQGAAEQAAFDIRMKMRSSEYEYQIYAIQQEQAAKKAAVDSYASNYAESLRAIDGETAARMEEAKNIHNAKLAEMKAATNSWGNLTKSWLDQIPGLLQAAFTGGGGFSGAIKGLLSGIGGDIGNKIFGGPEGLGAKLTRGLFDKGMSGEMATKFGGVLSAAGGALGSMAINFGLDLGKKLWNSLFGTAGRDAIKEFAATFKGGFDGPDGMHESLLKHGAEGEAMWQKISGTGRNNATQAAANIAAAKALLAKGTVDDDIAAAGFKTREELQRTADTATRVYETMRDSGRFTAAAVAEAFQKSKDAQIAAMGDTEAAQKKSLDDIAAKYTESLDKLDSEFKTLSDSVAGEAEEAEMGLVETKDRARIEEIKKEKAALEEKKKAEIQSAEDTYAATKAAAQQAAKDTDDALREIFDRGYDTTLRFKMDGLPEGVTIPHHGAGGYFDTPHMAVVGDRPEYITPRESVSQLAGEIARAMGGRASLSADTTAVAPITVTLQIHAPDGPGVRKAGQELVDLFRTDGALREKMRRALVTV